MIAKTDRRVASNFKWFVETNHVPAYFERCHIDRLLKYDILTFTNHHKHIGGFEVNACKFERNVSDFLSCIGC